MERKNTILLTVIAIATLLVAVVGATFAYFTATFTPTNSQNNKVEAKAAVLPTVTFDYGDTVSAPADLYPGYIFLKKVSVTGTCTGNNESCKNVDLVLTLKPDIDDAFGSNIKYAVYKSAKSNTDAITCQNDVQTSNETDGSVKYSYNSQCTVGDNVYNGTKFADAVEKGTITDTGFTGTFKTKSQGSTEETILIEDVSGTTADTYYILIDYHNDDSSKQDDEQGKSFSVTLEANLQP